MNEIIVKSASLTVIPGSIVFNNFDELYDQALQLREYIESVEVTEESIKATKKMLAAVNGKVKELEDERIKVKKEILSPYQELEFKVKQIVTTVKEAEQDVRAKVKALEEKERDEKEVIITDLFKKRMKLYPTLGMFGAGDFITPKHLNKSTSLKSVEEEMAEWFEARKRDIEVISSMENVTEILTEYRETKDLSLAMKIVKDRKDKQKELEQVRNSSEPTLNGSDSVANQYVITLSSEKDAKFVELFMLQNKIQYTMKKVGY